MVGNKAINLTILTATHFTDPIKSLDDLYAHLTDISKLLALDPDSPVQITLQKGNSLTSTLSVTVEMKDFTREPHGTEVKRSFEIQPSSTPLSVIQTSYEVGYEDDDRRKKLLYDYPLKQKTFSPEHIIALVVATTKSLMSTIAQERLGNNTDFQHAQNPVAPILHRAFPPVRVGLTQLQDAFLKLNDILKRHTNGLVETGIRYVHSSYHEFWVGCNFQELKDQDLDAWIVSYDRIGWSIAQHQDNKTRYSVDQILYQYGDDDFSLETAQPREIECCGWLSLTAADIFGSAVKFIEKGLPSGLPEEAQLEILEIMEHFPPNPPLELPHLDISRAPA